MNIETQSEINTNTNGASALTPKLAWQLAAPHTWPASIIPPLIAASAAFANTGVIRVLPTLVLLIICVLMQSSVNTLNDYFDFIKGSDTASDNVDPTDAVLVYNNINPKSALALAIGMLVTAFALGIYIIVISGWIPLAIAMVGALIVFLYSGGPAPLSYLPVGELVSGITMGALIPLACYMVLTGNLDFIVFVWSMPCVFGIALIMFTNNTCDIEKDVPAGRKTLSVLLGRKKCVTLYHAVLLAWMALICIITAIWFNGGSPTLPFMVLCCYPLVNALWKNPLTPETRIGAMAQICSVNVALGAFYALSIIAKEATLLIF